MFETIMQSRGCRFSVRVQASVPFAYKHADMATLGIGVALLTPQLFLVEAQGSNGC